MRPQRVCTRLPSFYPLLAGNSVYLAGTPGTTKLALVDRVPIEQGGAQWTAGLGEGQLCSAAVASANLQCCLLCRCHARVQCAGHGGQALRDVGLD